MTYAFIGGDPTVSGEQVSALSSMQLVTVIACVRILSESVASLPLYVYERLDKGRRIADETPLYDLLAVEPNPQSTAFTFIEALMMAVVLTGNGYAEIQTNGANQPIALWPLNPLKTKPRRTPAGDLVYEIEGDNGLKRVTVLDSDSIVPANVIAHHQSLGVKQGATLREMLKSMSQYHSLFEPE